MGIENPVHLLFIAVVALVVLGPRRLPELARALGKGVREFREAIGQGTHDADPAAEPVPPVGQALLTAPAPVSAPASATAAEPSVPEPTAAEPTVPEPSAPAPPVDAGPAAGPVQVDPTQTVRSGDEPDRGSL